MLRQVLDTQKVILSEGINCCNVNLLTIVGTQKYLNTHESKLILRFSDNYNIFSKKLLPNSFNYFLTLFLTKSILSCLLYPRSLQPYKMSCLPTSPTSLIYFSLLTLHSLTPHCRARDICASCGTVRTSNTRLRLKDHTES